MPTYQFLPDSVAALQQQHLLAHDVLADQLTLLEAGNPLYYGADPAGDNDSYPAFQAAVNAIASAGTGALIIPPGQYVFSQPVIVTQDSVVIRGGGRFNTLTAAGTLLKAMTGASLANWPQGQGILTLQGLQNQVEDLSLHGNGIAFNELAMTHSEGTVRHLIKSVEFRNQSVGPAMWNVGCEDVTWLKCLLDGSEAVASTQKLGAWLSCPSGAGSAVGCDFFAPTAIQAITWAAVGNNAGTLLCLNPAGSQNRVYNLVGCWLYDGSGYSGGSVFAPIDVITGAPADAAMGGSSNVLTTTTAFFTAAMVGNSIAVYPPGAAAPLTGTISAFTSTTQVTCSFTNTGSAFSGAFWWAAGSGSGTLGTIRAAGAHLVAQAATAWVNGWLPSNNSVELDSCTLVVASTNVASAFTFLTIPASQPGNHTAFVIGPGGVTLAFPGSPTFTQASGGSATHVNEALGIIGGATAANWTPATSISATPAVPGSAAAFLSSYACVMQVSVTGGTLTNINVNGVSVATSTPASFKVPPGGVVVLTYTVAPAWTWKQNLA